MLSVEDGTGLEVADSYVSRSELEQFLAENYITVDVSDERKDAVLREATRYHEAVYDYPYRCLSKVQALRVPLSHSINTADGREWSGIPAKLKDAICLLAVEALNGPLVVNQAAKRKVRSKVDVVESQFEYDAAERNRVFLACDALVRQLGGHKRSSSLQLVRR